MKAGERLLRPGDTMEGMLRNLRDVLHGQVYSGTSGTAEDVLRKLRIIEMIDKKLAGTLGGVEAQGCVCDRCPDCGYKHHCNLEVEHTALLRVGGCPADLECPTEDVEGRPLEALPDGRC